MDTASCAIMAFMSGTVQDWVRHDLGDTFLELARESLKLLFAALGAGDSDGR